MNKKIMIVGISVVMILLVSIFIVIQLTKEQCSYPVVLINGETPKQVVEGLNGEGIYFNSNRELNELDYFSSSTIKKFNQQICK